MQTNSFFVRGIPRITAIVLSMLLATGTLNLTNAAGPSLGVKEFPALAMALHDEPGPVHRPLASVGLTAGQTARINVVNSPDPNSQNPPEPVTVELCFHDSNGDLILDRSRRPVQK